MSTPLTDGQYSELVVALELLRSEYVGGCDYRVERTLRCHWLAGHLSPFAFIYLLQWFDKMPDDMEHSRQNLLYGIDQMVAELCEERTNASRL